MTKKPPLNGANGYFLQGNYEWGLSLWEVLADRSSPQLKLVKNQAINKRVGDFCFSSDRSSIIIACGKEIRFYSIPTLELQETQSLPLTEERFCRDFLFTLDGKKLLFVENNQLFAWDLGRKELVPLPSINDRNNCPGFNAHIISGLQFIPNTSLIAYKTFTNEHLICVRSMQGEIKAQIPHSSSLKIATRVFSDGKQFFKMEDQRISVSAIENLSIQKHAPIGSRIIHAIFSADNQSFLFINNYGELHRYEAISGREPINSKRKLNEDEMKESFHLINHWAYSPYPRNSYHCSFSSDARYILGGTRTLEGGRVRLSKTENGQIYCKLDLCYTAHALSWDNRHLIFAHKDQIEIRDTRSGKSLGTVSMNTPIADRQVDLVLSHAVYPTAYIAIMEVIRNKSTVWEVDWKQRTAKRLIRYPLLDRVKFTTGNQLIFQKDDNRSLFIWHPLTHAPNQILFNEDIEAFDATPDGLLAVICTIRAKRVWIRLWNLARKEQLVEQETSLSPFQIYTCIASNGRFITCWNGNAIQMFEFNGKELRLLWKLPQQLDVEGMSIKGVKNLGPHNTLLLSQLRVKV